tara:strand:- start:69 stop:281 length:213 start_codon:yes stop_codon:yes gene_type:complete
MLINLPTNQHAEDLNIVICEDQGIHEYKFNLGGLLKTIDYIIKAIDGDNVGAMPTHEMISKLLKRGAGCA